MLLPDGRPILTIKDFFRFAGVLPDPAVTVVANEAPLRVPHVGARTARPSTL